MFIKRNGDDIYYEIIGDDNSKKIVIYLKKVGDKYMRNPKCFGTHILEQTLDENNNVISEVIKENPHQVKCSLPDGAGKYFI